MRAPEKNASPRIKLLVRVSAGCRSTNMSSASANSWRFNHEKQRTKAKIIPATAISFPALLPSNKKIDRWPKQAFQAVTHTHTQRHTYLVHFSSKDQHPLYTWQFTWPYVALGRYLQQRSRLDMLGPGWTCVCDKLKVLRWGADAHLVKRPRS